MSSLPREIEEEILLRLPVKSILCVKSVCKSWYTYITSPKFVKDHLSLAGKNLRNIRIMIRVMDRPRGADDEFYSIDYASISSATSCKCDGAVRMNYPNNNRNRLSCNYHYIVGSCNGLFLLEVFDNATLFLWNPSTREYKGIRGPLRLRNGPPSYGFGYDTKIDNYKLVCIATGEFDDFSEVYVYTDGSWSRGQNIPYVYFDGTRGLLLNGALHWVGWSGDTATRVSTIICFDINSEKFIGLPFPEETMTCPEESYDVLVLGDSLCLVCTDLKVRVDVWVMKTYGVRESWTKQFTTNTHVNITPCPRWNKLYRFAKNGEILTQMDECFGLYDENNDKLRFLHINGADDGFLHSEIYVESLVSLNSGTFMGEKITNT